MADVSSSITWSDSPGDPNSAANAARLTAAILVTILPAFISAKTGLAPDSTDEFVFNDVSAGALKKCTLAQLLTSLLASPALTGTVDVQQAIQFSGDISPAQITANTNDYNPTNLATSSVLRLSTDASRNLTGLAGGSDGRLIMIHNVGSFNLVLIDDATSTAANRFALNHDLTIPPDGMVFLLYDATTSRWRSPLSHYHKLSDLTDAPVVAPAFAALLDGATITGTCDTTKVSQNWKVTLGGNRTLAISGAVDGMTGVIKVTQDGTGSRTLTLPAGSKVVSTGAGAITLSTAAGSIDILAWVYDGTNYFWGYGRGFS